MARTASVGHGAGLPGGALAEKRVAAGYGLEREGAVAMVLAGGAGLALTGYVLRRMRRRTGPGDGDVR
ncbi:hypothetical protein [Streptomyces sp. MST-110588]|uniref:hypothetical protein n=1 Tax=Streptomyces sp. MST-110588 TaxID=2833628 RepID=UPI001F5D8C6A|nr:hypothetical protein [Streptomyces sp. MST-110588]UNO41849.1 hypothetical protein KGS77_22775 [Streptomyces sp. MST-110588]